MDKLHTTEEAESVIPYNTEEEKHLQVERMFDNIAPSYDKMNSLMSFGMHRQWREKGLRMAHDALQFSTLSEDSRKEIFPEKILDVACGTGDLAFRLAEIYKDAHITGVDLSEGMLAVARKKLGKHSEENSKRITFQQADCLKLPYGDNEFDLITVAYGVRNFQNLEQGYREMYRVLRPGGAICVIELSAPQTQPLRMFYTLYSHYCIPIGGKLISGDYKAYSYLPQSIMATPQRFEMTQLMRKCGFRKCNWQSMTFGVVTIYIAIKQKEF